jgi:hypothetical protein
MSVRSFIVVNKHNQHIDSNSITDLENNSDYPIILSPLPSLIAKPRISTIIDADTREPAHDPS